MKTSNPNPCPLPQLPEQSEAEWTRETVVSMDSAASVAAAHNTALSSLQEQIQALQRENAELTESNTRLLARCIVAEDRLDSPNADWRIIQRKNNDLTDENLALQRMNAAHLERYKIRGKQNLRLAKLYVALQREKEEQSQLIHSVTCLLQGNPYTDPDFIQDNPLLKAALVLQREKADLRQQLLNRELRWEEGEEFLQRAEYDRNDAVEKNLALVNQNLVLQQRLDKTHAEIDGLKFTLREHQERADRISKMAEERMRYSYQLKQRLDKAEAALRVVQVNFQRDDASGNFLGDDDHEAWRMVTAALATEPKPVQGSAARPVVANTAAKQSETSATESAEEEKISEKEV